MELSPLRAFDPSPTPRPDVPRISDIFDALTASDRPYKRAVPVPKALDILKSEVGAGMLDQELFRLFTEGKVFESEDGG